MAKRTFKVEPEEEIFTRADYATRFKPGETKGNKSAVGNSGRPPRIITEDEAEELLHWVQDEDNYILRKFAAIRGYPQEYMWEMAHKCPQFAKAYKTAHNLISIRREEMANLGELNEKIYSRYASLHDKALKQHELEMKMTEAVGQEIGRQLNILDKGCMDKPQDIKDAKPRRK